MSLLGRQARPRECLAHYIALHIARGVLQLEDGCCCQQHLQQGPRISGTLFMIWGAQVPDAMFTCHTQHFRRWLKTNT